MKKIFIFLLLIAVAGSLSADADLWQSLNEDERVAFVMGVFIGGYSSSVFVDIVADHPDMEADMSGAFRGMKNQLERIYQLVQPHGEKPFMDYIDEFYKDESNEDINLFYAVTIILRQLST